LKDNSVFFSRHSLFTIWNIRLYYVNSDIYMRQLINYFLREKKRAALIKEQ
jgi:hypothetical protein